MSPTNEANTVEIPPLDPHTTIPSNPKAILITYTYQINQDLIPLSEIDPDLTNFYNMSEDI